MIRYTLKWKLKIHLLKLSSYKTAVCSDSMIQKLAMREKCPFWIFSSPYFPTFGMNTERYSVSLRIQSKCGKIRTGKTPNTDFYYAV